MMNGITTTRYALVIALVLLLLLISCLSCKTSMAVEKESDDEEQKTWVKFSTEEPGAPTFLWCPEEIAEAGFHEKDPLVYSLVLTSMAYDITSCLESVYRVRLIEFYPHEGLPRVKYVYLGMEPAKNNSPILFNYDKRSVYIHFHKDHQGRVVVEPWAELYHYLFRQVVLPASVVRDNTFPSELTVYLAEQCIAPYKHKKIFVPRPSDGILSTGF